MSHLRDCQGMFYFAACLQGPPIVKFLFLPDPQICIIAVCLSAKYANIIESSLRQHIVEPSFPKMGEGDVPALSVRTGQL